MDLIRDTGRGTWLLARAGDGDDVGGIAGTGFAAYARILHPLTAVFEDRSIADEHGDHPVLDEMRWRWADVAARTGIAVHPSVTWASASGRDDESDVPFPDGWRASPPEEGWFDPVVLAALTEHLARATSTPDDLVAGFWDGWSDLSGGSTLAFGWQGDDSPTAEERAEVGEWMAEHTAAHGRDQDAVAASLSVPRFAWPGRDLILAATDLPTLADPTWLEHTRLGPLVPLEHTPQMLCRGPRLGDGIGDRLGLDDHCRTTVPGRRRAGRRAVRGVRGGRGQLAVLTVSRTGTRPGDPRRCPRRQRRGMPR